MHRPKANKSKFIPLIIVLLSLVGLFLYVQVDKDIEKPSVVVEETEDGVLIVKNVEYNLEIEVPTGFDQPSDTSLDFYNEKRDCKFSVQFLDVEKRIDLKNFVSLSEIEREFLTIHEEEFIFVDDATSTLLYILETVETGRTEAYYEIINNQKLFILTAFSEVGELECYKNINS